MKISFTFHAEEMLKERKITKEEAELTVKSPEKVFKEEGKYYASKNIGRGVIEVVYTQYLRTELINQL